MNDTLEVIDLESLLEDEIECESFHNLPDNLACSHEVTHMTLWCETPSKVCANAAQAVRLRMLAGMVCENCRKPAADCWKVIAI